MANVYDLLDWMLELPGPRCNENALELGKAIDQIRRAVPGMSVEMRSKSVRIRLGVEDLFTPSFEIFQGARPVGLTDASFERLKLQVSADYEVRWKIGPQ